MVLTQIKHQTYRSVIRLVRDGVGLVLTEITPTRLVYASRSERIELFLDIIGFGAEVYHQTNQ